MIERLKKRKILNRYDKFNNNFYKKSSKWLFKIIKKKSKKSQLIDSNLDINNKQRYNN